ncbi:MAG: 1-phosphofructokinase family hexose kinase [Defluviitaleaceae bacterium]|nr:1-phosphofructokinase family hexose kinase [Defluviitaleaceae bacterium]MCL2276229.1 1-phosphofructokinase family hexose kinase [Defluviitaleaceae bacterium]
MANVTVVNLNPCLDWSWHIGAFTHGGMNRVTSTRQDAAGKGINVCIALKSLGLSPVCRGFNYRENGAAITQKLDEYGVAHDFVEADGAVRVNIKLYDDSGKMTELNQAGGAVGAEAIEDLKIKTVGRSPKPHELLKKVDQNFDVLVLSGSRPAGVPVDFYAQLCKEWQGKVILDCEGEALKTAIDSAPPFLIKPNLFELESTFGVQLPTQETIVNFSCTLIKKGVEMVCVSLGAEGALFVTQDEAFFSPALSLEVKAVQGAGDAMVAGLVYAMHSRQHATPAEMLRCAMAAAAATVTREGTRMCDRAGFDAMLPRVAVHTI